MDAGFSSHKQFNVRQLVILGIIILGLPILIIAAGSINNDIRNRAAGTSEVALKFSPKTGSFARGSTIPLKVVMHKTSTRAITVSGAQATISVNSKFTVTGAACMAPFNGLPFTKVNGTAVTVICAIATGAPPVSVATSDLPFATINLKVNDNAAAGTAPVTFTSTRVTESGVSGSAPDVSTAGSNGTFTILSTENASPTVSSGNAVLNLVFSPATVSIPPNATVKIMAQAGSNKIAFTNTVITFDKSKLKLASEISTNPNLSTVVEKTGMAAANSFGKAKIVIAAGPNDTKPTGNFEIASFQVTTAGTGQGSTQIVFSTAEMQYVNDSQIELSLDGVPLTASLNGQSPTGVGGDLTIPVGNKDSITVNIGGGNTGDGPKINLSASLSQTQNNPDMYFRLRVQDDLYFQEHPNADLSPMCDSANAAEKDYYIPMRATGSVYKPVSQIQAPPPGPLAQIASDGTVKLSGLAPDRYYTLFLKAPKFRGAMMAEHVKLSLNGNTPFDFSGSPLEPGDLPDPNNSLKQDCTVNSIDLSLIVSKIGSTNAPDLTVADVNFDNIVNGNDVSKVVNTLSTKPDDDI